MIQSSQGLSYLQLFPNCGRNQKVGGLWALGLLLIIKKKIWRGKQRRQKPAEPAWQLKSGQAMASRENPSWGRERFSTLQKETRERRIPPSFQSTNFFSWWFCKDECPMWPQLHLTDKTQPSCEWQNSNLLHQKPNPIFTSGYFIHLCFFGFLITLQKCDCNFLSMSWWWHSSRSF